MAKRTRRAKQVDDTQPTLFDDVKEDDKPQSAFSDKVIAFAATENEGVMRGAGKYTVAFKRFDTAEEGYAWAKEHKKERLCHYSGVFHILNVLLRDSVPLNNGGTILTKNVLIAIVYHDYLGDHDFRAYPFCQQVNAEAWIKDWKDKMGELIPFGAILPFGETEGVVENIL